MSQLSFNLGESKQPSYSDKHLIGTSGYYYNDWKGKFYPDKLKKADWLSYYAQLFNTVEINNTFYKHPDPRNIQIWKEKTPQHFHFTIKAYRLITHYKKLVNVQREVSTFYNSISALEDKLASVLWQLPAQQQFDPHKLEEFCRVCSPEFNNIMEFRHPSWFRVECYEILRKYRMGFCMISAPNQLPEDVIVTNPTAYLRFHGKSQWYDYLYTKEELKLWVKRLENLKYRQLLIYFNNDYHTHAITNARQIREMLA